MTKFFNGQPISEFSSTSFTTPKETKVTMIRTGPRCSGREASVGRIKSIKIHMKTDLGSSTAPWLNRRYAPNVKGRDFGPLAKIKPEPLICIESLTKSQIEARVRPKAIEWTGSVKAQLKKH